MSEPTTTPTTPTEPPAPPPLGAQDSLAAYREARATALSAPPVETPVAPSVTPEQEADDQTKPDTAISDAARTLRKNRADERKAKIQEEINQLTKQKYELIEHNNRLLRERQTPPAADVKPSAPAIPAAKPKAEDYPEDYDQYLDARDAWNRAQWQAEQQQASQQAQLQARAQTYQTRADAFRAAHPDYDTAIANPALVASPLMLEAIQDSDQGPAIAYYLATDPGGPELSRRLAAMTPAQLFKALGKLEAQITAPAPEPQKPVVPAAPAPITPVSGTTTAPLTRDPKDINSVSEWRTRRAEYVGGRS